MSAYVNGRSNQQLGGQNNQIQQPEVDIPSLPKVANELEAYFTISRKLEVALAQEKALSAKLVNDLKEMRTKYQAFAKDSEMRIQNLAKENEAKVQTLVKDHETKLKECLSREREASKREETLKHQLMAMQQADLRTKEQILDFSKANELLKEEKKKAELASELLRSNLEHSRNQENYFRGSIKTLVANSKAKSDELEVALREVAKLKEEIEKSRQEKALVVRDFERVRTELDRYRASWSKVVEMEKQSKKAIEDAAKMKSRIDSESIELQSKLAQMEELVQHEKRRRDEQEESLKRERRDKQIALNCLHNAEAKLSQVSQDLDDLRQRTGMSSGSKNDKKFEITF